MIHASYEYKDSYLLLLLTRLSQEEHIIRETLNQDLSKTNHEDDRANKALMRLENALMETGMSSSEDNDNL